MMSIIGSLVSTNIDFLRQPPFAPIFILVLTLVVNIVMSYANKRSMDLPAYRKMMVESSRARKELMDAMKTGNQRRISQAQNKQNDLMKEQQKASSGRISDLAYSDPDNVIGAPRSTVVGKLDEPRAAHPRTICLSWKSYCQMFP